jgi:hypothetical protein
MHTHTKEAQVSSLHENPPISFVQHEGLHTSSASRTSATTWARWILRRTCMALRAAGPSFTFTLCIQPAVCTYQMPSHSVQFSRTPFNQTHPKCKMMSCLKADPKHKMASCLRARPKHKMASCLRARPNRKMTSCLRAHPKHKMMSCVTKEYYGCKEHHGNTLGNL